MKQKEPNTFADMEEKSAANSEKKVETPKVQEPIRGSGEVSIDDFSDTAVGDRVKYTRPDLKGTIDVVDKFQVFPPDFDVEPKLTENKKSEFWTPTLILFWESENEEGVQNKEYISGAKVWKNRDGNQPSEINFWYEGGSENDNQSCILWEKVAECLEIEPKHMSPRQFIAFLNGKPKFNIAAQKTKNYKAKPGEPVFIYKNMPGDLIKK